MSKTLYGLRYIIQERTRQVSSEGFKQSDDDKYVKGELARAAYAYESSAEEIYKTHAVPTVAPDYWPFDKSWFKSHSSFRDLVKAGALYMAEAERAERAGDVGASLMARSLVQHVSALLDCAALLGSSEEKIRDKFNEPPHPH
jgi:hypothetical protein